MPFSRILLGKFQDQDAAADHRNGKVVVEVQPFLEVEDSDRRRRHNRQARPQCVRERHPSELERLN